MPNSSSKIKYVAYSALTVVQTAKPHDLHHQSFIFTWDSDEPVYFHLVKKKEISYITIKSNEKGVVKDNGARKKMQ